MMKRYATLVSVAALALAAPGFAQTIIAPTSAVASSEVTPIVNTINQIGLSAAYSSGVTDFDSYIASNPSHSLGFGAEWFSDSGVTTARVLYDFGGAVTTDRLALWNEDASGVGQIALFGSLDNVVFNLIDTFSPVDNPLNADYLAQVFSYSTTTARYLRFDLSGCPQSGLAYEGCAIGEVAFRSATIAGVVPEPATWAMLIGGVGMAGGALRRRRAKVKTTASFA
jgi:hypothetical protein